MRGGAEALADAFSDFSLAAGRLETSYQELQKEVAQLRAVLAARSQALRSSQAENTQVKLALRRIVDSLPCGVIVLEEQGHVSLINPEAQRLLGLAGEKIESLADTPLHRHRSLAVAMESPTSDESEDELCVTTPSAARWLAVRSRHFLQDSRGSVTAATPSYPRQQTILIVRDITHHKKLEEEREAARRVVALAETSAVLAHEVRNPLASLELFVGLIGEGGMEATECVPHLRAGLRKLAATVNNVLRWQSNGSLQLSPVVLADAMRSAVEFARPLAQQKQIELALTDRAGDMVIAGDENAIQQLVLNLVLNALHHTPAGGGLQITVTRLESDSEVKATIEFRDTGCGIAAEMLPLLFKPGFSASGRSPGLGLAVCQKITEQHGGSIRVSSRPGEGTLVVVEIPAAR